MRNDINKNYKEKIENDLREIITTKLLDGFENRKGNPVIKVEAVNIYSLAFDEHSDRENIIVETINANARVRVSFDDDGSEANDDRSLINSKPIIFSYNDDIKEYVLPLTFSQ